MRTSLWRVLTLVLLLASTGPGRACAAGKGPSLEIDPLVIERAVAPGSMLSYEINVENQDQLEPVTLEATVVDIEEDNRGAYVLVPSGTTSYSLSRWTKVNPTRFTIPPGGSQRIDVTVSVPRGVSGGRYGAVAISTVPERTSPVPGALAASVFTFRMASFIELVIAGAVPRTEAYVESFDVELSSEYPEYRQRVGEDALVFTVAVKNEGNSHIVTGGSLIVETEDARTVARYPLGGGRGVILPGATVELRSVIRSALPPGEYRARAVVDYGVRRPAVANAAFVVEDGQVLAEGASGSALQKFVVVPDQLDMMLRPGSFRTAVLEVINRGDEELVLNGAVLPLKYDLLGALLPSEDRAGGLSWVTVSPEQIRVGPGMSRRVRVIARAPQDAIGGHYADVVFASQGSALQTESGASLFVFVGEGDAAIEKSGRAELVTVVIEDGFLTADTLFVNEGNVHLNLSGELFLHKLHPQIELEDGQIMGPREELIASIPLETTGNPVLPSTERLIRFLLPATLEDGEYELAVRVDYGGDQPAIARLRFYTEGGIACE